MSKKYINYSYGQGKRCPFCNKPITNYSTTCKKHSTGRNVFKKGEGHPLWKGNEVGYYALHSWIERQLGKPQECANCGSTEPRKYEWANKSGQYLREISDWLRLCTPCHRKYDNSRKRSLANEAR